MKIHLIIAICIISSVIASPSRTSKELQFTRGQTRQGSAGPSLRLYDNMNQGGTNFETYDYVPNFCSDFNDNAESAVMNGIWIMYDDPNYDSFVSKFMCGPLGRGVNSKFWALGIV